MEIREIESPSNPVIKKLVQDGILINAHQHFTDQKVIQSTFCIDELDEFRGQFDANKVRRYPVIANLGSLRIMSYNVWYDMFNQKQRYRAIIEMIIKSNANVVCLQEVTNHFYKVLFDDKRIKMKYKSLGFQKPASWYSVCILSQLPAANVYEYPYTDFDDYVLRSQTGKRCSVTDKYHFLNQNEEDKLKKEMRVLNGSTHTFTVPDTNQSLELKGKTQMGRALIIAEFYLKGHTHDEFGSTDEKIIPVYVATGHFESRDNKENASNRHNQFRDIFEVLFKDEPNCVVTGDFNFDNNDEYKMNVDSFGFEDILINFG